MKNSSHFCAVKKLKWILIAIPTLLMLVFQFKPYSAFHALLKVVPVDNYQPETIHLNWDSATSNNLDSIQKSYSGKRYIFPKPPYVNVHFENNEIAKLRFKGDYGRHVKRDEWSFRLKLPNDSIWRGTKKINFHHPRERLGINEYVFQKHMKLRGHLALDYEFSNVVKNEKDTVLYAHEECLGNAYLRKNKLSGVILKFDDEPFFTWMMYHVPDSFPASVLDPFFNTAKILSVGKVVQEKLEVFEAAKYKLNEWRCGRLKTSEVFKLDKTANFFGLIEAWGAQHVIGMNNLKFYYDDSVGRFELIASDGNSSLSGKLLIHSEVKIHRLFFNDEAFKEEYIKHVKHNSNGREISSFLVRNMRGIKSRMKVLKDEYPDIDNNLAYLHYNFQLCSEIGSFKELN